MVTRFRLPSAGSPPVNPAFQSYSHANGVRRNLPLVDSSALSTNAQTPDGADHLVAGDTSHFQGTSEPLGAQTITNGQTVKLAIQCLEAHAGNNLFLQLFIAIFSNDGGTNLQTLLAKTLDGLELSTSIQNRFMNPTLTAGYTTTGGERLVVEISVSGTPTGAGGVQGHNASLRWGAAGAGGDNGENDTDTGTTLNPWFEMNDTLVFEGQPAAKRMGGVPGQHRVPGSLKQRHAMWFERNGIWRPATPRPLPCGA